MRPMHRLPYFCWLCFWYPQGVYFMEWNVTKRKIVDWYVFCDDIWYDLKITIYSEKNYYVPSGALQQHRFGAKLPMICFSGLVDHFCIIRTLFDDFIMFLMVLYHISSYRSFSFRFHEKLSTNVFIQSNLFMQFICH